MAVITAIGQIGGTVDGTNQDDDILVLLSAVDEVNGNNGNDEIAVILSEVDSVNGGNGSDSIYLIGSLVGTTNGNNGSDLIDASLAGTSVTLAGGNGNDSLGGGSRADNLSGNNGDDTLFGAGGNDHIDGGRGNDYITGGTGDDTMTGGKGADSFFYNYTANATQAFGTDGFDHITDFKATEGDKLFLHDTLGSTNTNHVIVTTDGTDTTVTFEGPGTDRTITLDDFVFNGTTADAVAAGWLVFV
jgi:Ca2+-binding RTX toxin-like protein